MKKKAAIAAMTAALLVSGVVFATNGLRKNDVGGTATTVTTAHGQTTTITPFSQTNGTANSNGQIGNSHTGDNAKNARSVTPLSNETDRAVNDAVQQGQLLNAYGAEQYESKLRFGEIDYSKDVNANQYDNGTYTDESIPTDMSDTDVEFVTYMDQELTAEYGQFIVTNLSSNSCNMDFTISEGNKTVYQTSGVVPGESRSVDLTKVLGKGKHTVTVNSCAVSAKGVKLNALDQDVEIDVKSITSSGVTEGKLQENQKSGTTYETGVIYDAENMQCSVQLPVILTIRQGSIGTDFNVSYRIVNAKEGTRFSINTTKGLNADGTIKLFTPANANGQLSSVEATLTAGNEKTDMDCVVQKGGSALYSVGPIHCYLTGDRKLANSNYYGATTFKVSIKG